MSRIKDNIIHYRAKDKTEVTEIISEMETAFQLLKSCIRFISVSRANHLVSLLEEYNIPYTMERSNGDKKHSICWGIKYDKQVKEILARYEKIQIPTGLPQKICFSDPDDLQIFARMLQKAGIPFRIIGKGDTIWNSQYSAIEIDSKYYNDAQRIMAEFTKAKKNEGSIIEYLNP